MTRNRRFLSVNHSVSRVFLWNNGNNKTIEQKGV